jgi:hypothetical protein
MTKAFFLILIFSLSISNLVVGARTTIYLKDQNWSIAGNTVLSYDKLSAFDSATTKSFTSEIAIDPTLSLITEIEISQDDFNSATLYLYAASSLFQVYVNGDRIENELNGDNFHADMTLYSESESMVLQLVPKQSVSVAQFDTFLKDAQIAFVGGLYLCHFDVKVDPFFGGKLIEVEVKNREDKDVDGKIYARLYNPDTMELVAQNNNCAFARKGLEAHIEVNFPESEATLKGNLYLVEIQIVDKEDHESIIDQLNLPLLF